MQVSGIEQRSARRYIVRLDSGNTLTMDTKEFRSTGLRENEEITEERFAQLMEEQRKGCLRRCGMLLKDRDYPERRLREKLRETGYDESIADAAVESLKEAGYLDDLRYAQSYVRYHMADRSRLRIRQDLMKRGISPEMIGQAFDSLEGESPENAEEEQIRTLLEKRHFNPDSASFEEKQKMRAFLYGKGYSGELIHRMV